MSHIGVRVALLVATVAIVGQRLALGDPCKPDGTKCRTNASCCGKVCVTDGSSPATCCTPTTCAQGACGMVADGTCPDVLDCGSCTAPDTCGGGGTPHVCGCTPTTCAEQGKNCGTIADGCGGTLECGECTSPTTCGGGGTPNVCGGGTPTCGGIVDANCKLIGSPPCFQRDSCATGCCCWQCEGATDFDPAVCSSIPVGVCNTLDFCFGNRNCQCPGAHCSNDADCCSGADLPGLPAGQPEFCTGGVCTPKQPDGTECQFSAGCLNGCCCTSQDTPGAVCATSTECTAAGMTCAP